MSTEWSDASYAQREETVAEEREAAVAEPRRRQGDQDPAEEGGGRVGERHPGRAAQAGRPRGQEARQGRRQARHSPQPGGAQEGATGPPDPRQGAGRQVRPDGLIPPFAPAYRLRVIIATSVPARAPPRANRTRSAPSL